MAKWEMPAHGYKVYFGGSKNVLKDDGGNSFTIL